MLIQYYSMFNSVSQIFSWVWKLQCLKCTTGYSLLFYGFISVNVYYMAKMCNVYIAKNVYMAKILKKITEVAISQFAIFNRNTLPKSLLLNL